MLWSNCCWLWEDRTMNSLMVLLPRCQAWLNNALLSFLLNDGHSQDKQERNTGELERRDEAGQRVWHKTAWQVKESIMLHVCHSVSDCVHVKMLNEPYYSKTKRQTPSKITPVPWGRVHRENHCPVLMLCIWPIMRFPVSPEEGCHPVQHLNLTWGIQMFSFAVANASGVRKLLQMCSTLPQKLSEQHVL